MEKNYKFASLINLGELSAVTNTLIVKNLY